MSTTQARSVDVRPLGPEDRPAWQALWEGYQAFYRVAIAPETTALTWSRLHDPREPMQALGAYEDGALLGIVHTVTHRSTWTAGDYVYLQDLFVAEEARTRGLARALIEAVYERARTAGASRVYWLTHETNDAACRLYDRIADRPGFIQYRKIL